MEMLRKEYHHWESSSKISILGVLNLKNLNHGFFLPKIYEKIYMLKRTIIMCQEHLSVFN